MATAAGAPTKPKTRKTVVCRACGWGHFTMTRREAEAEVARFNAYFDGLPPEKRRAYYGGKTASIADYERCHRCGGAHRNFRPAVAGEIPAGCTLQPIIEAHSLGFSPAGPAPANGPTSP